MKTIILIFLLNIVLVLIPIAHAQMESANYWISTSVVSGGGLHVSSSNFQAYVTLGQPSPVMDPINQPWSQNYELYPGFWYTLVYYEVPKQSKSLPFILLLLNE